MKNIRELGSIPSNSMHKFKGCPERKLLEELNIINEELKKFSHVNMKAMEQFLSSSDQQRLLLERLDEVDHGKDVSLESLP